MSLILEALRKSEAQRRRAQAPDLFSEPVAATRQAATARPRWWAGAMAAFALLALAGWLLRGQWQATPQPATGVAAVASSAAPARNHRAVDVDVAASGADADATPRNPGRSMPMPTTGSVADAPAVMATPQAAPPVEPPPITGERRPATITAPTVGVAPAEPAFSPAPATGVAKLPPIQPVLSPTTPTTSANALLRLADLSSVDRLQLPALKMSMHLWDAAPAQRFVIIDGERKVQGDRIGDTVVEEITPDGVVLAWQGRRLKLVIR